jgi:hypothetical protein
MYTTSTFFNKAQTRGVTIPVLIELYRQELEYQNVNEIEVSGNSLVFSNESFKIAFNAYGNKLSGFSNGQIDIEESGPEFIVTLHADVSALFIDGGIIGGIVIILFLVGSGFNLTAFGLGGVAFILYSAIAYIFTLITFPIYFTSVRNDIERLLQSETVQEYHRSDHE